MASPSKHGGLDPHHNKSVAVVGAGVSGLAAAYRLKSCGLNVTVFEAEDRAGGSIRSASHNGLIWDEGANTMTESEAEVGMLIDKLGLWKKQQIPVSQNKRYIVKNGRPELIPSNIISFMKSNFLSAQAKLRMLLEPMQSSSLPEDSSEDVNESVGNFFQRRFGKEVVDYLVDPFVAGTSGGDPDSLSARHTFPEIWHLEKNFGSIIGGFIQSKLFHKNEEKQIQKMPNRRARLRGSFSFYDGMQTLTDKLCEDLGVDNVKLSSKVLSLSYSHDGKASLQNWSVAYSPNNRSKRPAVKQPFDAVIMTWGVSTFFQGVGKIEDPIYAVHHEGAYDVTAWEMAPLCKLKEMRLTKGGKHFSFDFLPRVTYLPMSIIVTSFKKEDVKRPLEGFGVLVPSKEQENGFRTLGTLFSSMMFPDRAPDDQYLYTTFIGGNRNRDLAGASTDKLMPVVKSDLKRLLGVEGEPTFVKHVYWANAFPLYNREYDSVLEAIDTLEQELPGFYYAGNHRGGLSVGKAITSGLKAADLVNSYLNSLSEKMLADDADVDL